MIFVTTGFQIPFDRLIKAMDEIALLLEGTEIIAQIAKTNYKVNNMNALDFVLPADFNNYISKAELIVSHAGMGTIISTLVKEKPIIVMPRLKKYGEVTTDHQLATVRHFEKQKFVYVAYNELELKEKVFNILNGDLKPLHKIGKYASDQLISSLRSFILS